MFDIIHVEGDYIPRRIRQDAAFYEQPFLDILADFRQPGAVVVDGGANIGNHTLYFAGILGCDVVAFEPEPHNAACLAANVLVNGLSSKVRLARHGLGRQAETVTLRMNVQDNYGTFSAKPAKDPNAAPNNAPMAVAAAVKTLDQALRDEGVERPVSILKLDVEGMECDALAGALGTIRASLPVVAVECTEPEELRRMESLLGEFDYFLFEVANATPTFIFLSQDNPAHREGLARRLRAASLGKAQKTQIFKPGPGAAAG